MSGWQETAGIFREEAGERLDAMVETLLGVERNGSTPQAIDSLLREAHSIKGSASMLGLEDVGTLAHGIEELLSGARQAGHLEPSMIDPLLTAADALRQAVGSEVDGSPATGDAPSMAPPGEETVADAAQAAAPVSSSDQPGRRTSLRVDAAKVDSLLESVGEAVLHHRRLTYALSTPAHGEQEASDLLERGEVLLDDVHGAAIDLRTLPLSSITDPLPRAVRDIAAAEGKQVELRLGGTDIALDRTILDGTAEAVAHLLRNAVAHGIERPAERERAGKRPEGRVYLRAEQRGDGVVIEVVDDGRGVGQELLARVGDTRSLADVLCEAGLSTAQTVTQVAGRGVGMDAVRRHAERLGGEFQVESEPGHGTSARMVLPLSLARLHVLLAERGGQVFGVPMRAAAQAIIVDNATSLLRRRSVEMAGEPVPLADVMTLLGGDASSTPAGAPAVLVEPAGRRVAVLFDRLLGEEDVLVKPMGPLLAQTPGYLGAAVLGDERLALVLDPSHLARAAETADARVPVSRAERATPTVLVVDDQFTVRELQRSILEAAGYRVTTARDGREAWDALSGPDDVDVLVTDIEMPHMDGLELLEAIRRSPQLSSLPVVIVTSRKDEEDERRGLDAGADAYIVKERFDQQALLETVGRLTRRP